MELFDEFTFHPSTTHTEITWLSNVMNRSVTSMEVSVQTYKALAYYRKVMSL